MRQQLLSGRGDTGDDKKMMKAYSRAFCLFFALLNTIGCEASVDVPSLYQTADGREAKAAIWQSALASDDASQQKEALLLLGRVGGESVVSPIAPFLNHDNAQLRLTAAFALGISGAPNAVDILQARIAQESDAAVEAVIWKALANLNAPRIQAHIVDAWDHEPEMHPALAQASAFLWAFHRDKLEAVDKGLVQRLLQATQSDNEDISVFAAAALARVRKDAVLFKSPTVLSAFQHTQNDRARQLLIKLLGAVGDASVDKVLNQILQSQPLGERTPSEAERAEAAAALVMRAKDTKLASVMEWVLNAPNWSVRAAAFQAMNHDQVAAVRSVLEKHEQDHPADRASLAPILHPIEFRDETKDSQQKVLPYTEVLRARDVHVVMQTSRGKIVLQLLPEAPYTAWNFLQLANKGFYNGTTFHRVVPNFVAQGGDPTGRGDGGPGYSIREEWSLLPHDVGYVGMATSGKDTGGSQFFFNTARNPHLDWHYTVFAKVVEGLDVMMALQQGDSIETARMVD